MNDQEWYRQLADYLRKEGHSEDKVERIVAVVRQYDVSTNHDSVMDSIASGKLNLSGMIKEALGDSES